MAKLDTKRFPFPELGIPADWTAHEDAFKALLAKSAALPDGEIVGAVLQWQRGDGYATYVVTKASPLTVAHVPYTDAWTIEPALIRGLNRADVLAQLHLSKMWATLAAKSRFAAGPPPGSE